VFYSESILNGWDFVQGNYRVLRWKHTERLRFCKGQLPCFTVKAHWTAEILYRAITVFYGENILNGWDFVQGNYRVLRWKHTERLRFCKGQIRCFTVKAYWTAEIWLPVRKGIFLCHRAWPRRDSFVFKWHADPFREQTAAVEWCVPFYLHVLPGTREQSFAPT
jgi:hypothetical protein